MQGDALGNESSFVGEEVVLQIQKNLRRIALAGSSGAITVT